MTCENFRAIDLLQPQDTVGIRRLARGYGLQYREEDRTNRSRMSGKRWFRARLSKGLLSIEARERMVSRTNGTELPNELAEIRGCRRTDIDKTETIMKM